MNAECFLDTNAFVYNEDLSDRQLYGRVRVRNPFGDS